MYAPHPPPTSPLRLHILSLVGAALVVAVSCATPSTGGSATRYRQGDFVVYRYTGSFTTEPVLLREEIIEQVGNRLTIRVEATRGVESRAWIQVVTDTPENQRNEKLDALFELIDGKKVQLDNLNSEDAYRLYAWIIPAAAGEPKNVQTGPGNLPFAGREFQCVVETGVFVSDGAESPFSFSVCDEFLWTNGPAAITGPDGVVIWQRDVLEFGHN